MAGAGDAEVAIAPAAQELAPPLRWGSLFGHDLSQPFGDQRDPSQGDFVCGESFVVQRFGAAGAVRSKQCDRRFS